ncbi:MAG: penicillin acylase family protein [Halioglobus sp.]
MRAQRPHWQRSDVFALGALMAFQSANNLQNEVLRLALAQVLDSERFSAFTADDSTQAYPLVLPPSSKDETALARTARRVALLDPETNPRMPTLGFGSNGWVLAAQKSASGLPLFAFDSHDELGLPNLFYEVHLFFGEQRQLRGWSVAGLPGVINGFNEHIAWGFTNIGDTQDVFLEQRSADDPTLFKSAGAWYRARSESVSIAIAGEEARELRILHTRNGPLISDDPPLSLAWAVQRLPAPALDSMLQLNLASDWRTFNAALDAFPAPSLNATYADVQGTIGFRTAGALPLRGTGEGLMPLDGSQPANAWQGMVAAQAMPQRVNPPEGFFAAANARVNRAGDGPLVSADNAAPYRIARLQAVLGRPGRFTLEDMQALQMDRRDEQAAMVLPTLVQGLNGVELSPRAERAQALLANWLPDPVADADSAPALLFQQWYLSLAEELFAADTGELWPQLAGRSYLLNQALDHLILRAPDSPWWRGERSLLLARSLERALATLAGKHGDDMSRWRLDEQLHVRLRHALGDAAPGAGWLFNAADVPWAGGPSTVGRARYSYARPFAVDAAATVRVVAEMSKPPRVLAIMPGGQSGHPLSPYYADQYPGWLAGALLPVSSRPPQPAGQALVFRPQ